MMDDLLHIGKIPLRGLAAATSADIAVSSLLLLALILGLEELYESAQPPECECDSHECFLRHKQDALRGAVSRARHK